VEVYINRLRQKIDENRAAKIINTMRGVGYSLRGPEPGVQDLGVPHLAGG
jgi:DNA-binding response OmpR family regulator